MLIIENINKLTSFNDQNISVEAVQITSNQTYEIIFRHQSALGWLFTYVIHRDMFNPTNEHGGKYVGTLRYTNKGTTILPWGSHREDCLKTRLKRMDMFFEFLHVLVIEWKLNNNIININ